MYQPKKINIGDRVTLKKNHPCGGNQFVITRVGMDFRMKCQTCQKEIWKQLLFHTSSQYFYW